MIFQNFKAQLPVKIRFAGRGDQPHPVNILFSEGSEHKIHQLTAQTKLAEIPADRYILYITIADSIAQRPGEADQLSAGGKNSSCQQRPPDGGIKPIGAFIGQNKVCINEQVQQFLTLLQGQGRYFAYSELFQCFKILSGNSNALLCRRLPAPYCRALPVIRSAENP